MTVARLLRGSLALQVLGGAALALWLLPDAVKWLALPLGAAAPIVVTATSIGLQLAIDAAVDPRRPRSTLRNALHVWIGECTTSLLMFGWYQPFRAGFPEPRIVRDPSRPALLLVHGYACNRAIWLPLLRSGLLAGCNVATVNLEPIFADIDGYVATLDAAVDRLRAASGAPRVTLVCHSMGGLAARAYLRARGNAAIDRLITIATPHRGTIFGHLGRGRNARQMTCGSSWLEALLADTTPAALARQVHIASRDDNLINPRAGLALDGASAAHWLDGVGHLATVADPRVWRLLETEVRRKAMSTSRATVD